MAGKISDETFDAIMRLAFKGELSKNPDTILNQSKETIKAIKKIDKEERALIETDIQNNSPYDTKGVIKTTALNKATISGQFKSQFGGTTNEIIGARIVQRVLNASIKNIVGSFNRELTGGIDKETDITDFQLAVTFEKEEKPFVIGVDAKFSFDPKKAGKEYKRSGSNDKKQLFNELEPLFAGKELHTITYLLTNLYFHQKENSEFNNQYDTYIKEISDVINLTVGLRTLLPTNKNQRIKFGNPQSIQGVVEKDTRIFVLLNHKLFLMTSFLEAIQDAYFAGRSSSKSQLDHLTSNLKQILDSINSGQNIGELDIITFEKDKKEFTFKRATGQFYKNKLKKLAQMGSTTNAYSEFKTGISDPLIGSRLDALTYLVQTVPLKIKGA